MRPVAGRERHRHQLALVAEFGDEDDAEADQECVHGGSSGLGPEEGWNALDRASVDAWSKVLLTRRGGPGDRGSSPSVSISRRGATPLRRTRTWRRRPPVPTLQAPPNQVARSHQLAE